MNLWFFIVLVGVGIQRIWEMARARRHARWIVAQGGYEAGREHYPLLVGVHLFFFVSLILEVAVMGSRSPAWWGIPLFLFLSAQGLRIGCIHSLGPYWNTRIMIAPGHPTVVKGPYRYLRHPNYVVVVAELFSLPLIFGAYMTATVVSAVNLWVLLRIRIPAEEKALAEATGYRRAMGSRNRWFPRREQETDPT
ncbi:isoprenylcysteine carboxyl methyltransferase family protein [Paludifilum halophilum]|uniref:Isoprenylcysteine carboxyl methyltransferase n=1 Tax=Paludifilum halophilum TaxID=1642702 RepID=A0A235B6N0_9BACL|nr:isoprenylcysteine carboxyl methyltransferase family protein [Paludifilum halophilum]OYD07265.1 hypothetical protein CHM34_12855 [Paludifilum halophilum]